MDPKFIATFIDWGLEKFWKLPGTAKIEGAIAKESAAKYYLIGQGLLEEDADNNVDQIKSKLATLAEPSPPASPPDGKSSVSDISESYQGPDQSFKKIAIWIEDKKNVQQVGCSFFDGKESAGQENNGTEHLISQTIINWLDAAVGNDDLVLLRWSPYESSKSYRTSFRVVPTKCAISDVVLGKDWWEDPKPCAKSKSVSSDEECEKRGKKHKKREMKSIQGGKERMSTDKQSVYSSSSTNKSRDKGGHRKHSESKSTKALRKTAKAIYELALDNESSDGDSNDDG